MTAPKIIVEATLSREGLLELRMAVDALLRDLGHEDAVTPHLARAADRKVTEVWSRVGSNIRGMLVTAAITWPDGSEFSMNDLAEALAVPPKTVRSWYRNLGRTLKQVDEAIPEPPLLTGRWDGGRNLYTMPSLVRRSIIDREMPPVPKA